MTQGVSGYFDIAGTEGFTGRFFYSEEYDLNTGKRVVSIPGISVQSLNRGGTWYPGGTVKVDGETIGAMNYSGGVTHSVSAGMSEAWNDVKAIVADAQEFPWSSSEIEDNSDGSKSVTFDVNISFYHTSSSARPAIKGSYTVDLTRIQRGLVYINDNGQHVKYQCYIKNGENWDLYAPYIKDGTSWDMCS